MDHLHKRNLPLNSAVTARTAPVPESGYLWIGPIDRAALTRLERSKSKIGDWRGIVHCQVIHDAEVLARERTALEGCYLERGPFFFFGDADLLARIDTALREGD